MHSQATFPRSDNDPAAGRTAAIVLFGELLVDCFPDREVTGGAPFNVSRHLLGLGRRAGLDPILVTRVGKDERGARLQEVLKSAGLALEGVQQDPLHPTGLVRIALDGGAGGHRFSITPDQAWDFIQTDMVRLIGRSRLPQWIYFGTLAQRGISRRALRALLQASPARGFLDVNLRDPWVRKDVLRWSLAKATVVKMNLDELLRVAGMLGLDGTSPKALGARLISAFDIRRLLVTEGGPGAWSLDADGGYVHTEAPGPAIEVVDSVGAGDAFAAVCLIGLTREWPVEQTLERAHRFAGEVCRIRGAIPDDDDFYRPFIAQWRLAGKEAV